MKLWGVEGEHIVTTCQIWRWEGNGWLAYVEQVTIDSWRVWVRFDENAELTLYNLYVTPVGARDALVRAVKRLALRIGKARAA